MTWMELSWSVERRARRRAWLARGHPDRLRCDKKLPFEWPDPSHPGVGHLWRERNRDHVW